MKIMVLTGNFPPVNGGISVFLWNVCDQLYRRGHKIEVLAPSIEGDSEAGVRQPYPVYYWKRRRRLASVVPIFLSLYYALRGKVDIVFLGHLMSTSALGTWLLWKVFRVPYVILAHGYDIVYLTSLVHRLVDRVVSRHVLKDASHVFANSKYTMDRAIEAGYEEKRMEVAHPGVDVGRFRPHQDDSAIRAKYGPGDKKILLTVANMFKNKGYENVLRVLPQVLIKVPNLIYLVVGRGVEEILKSQVQTLGIEGNVRFAGYVPHADLPPYYCACDVFILTSGGEENHPEAFGVAFLEANACGKPVIGGNVGGVTETVLDGVTGMLVNPYDTDEIANALIRMLTNEELARRLGEKGRQRVEKQFSWQIVGDKIATSLQKAARKNGDLKSAV